MWSEGRTDLTSHDVQDLRSNVCKQVWIGQSTEMEETDTRGQARRDEALGALRLLMMIP